MLLTILNIITITNHHNHHYDHIDIIKQMSTHQKTSKRLESRISKRLEVSGHVLPILKRGVAARYFPSSGKINCHEHLNKIQNSINTRSQVFPS